MLRTDAWANEATWSGWLANRVLYYPSVDLQLRDTAREVRRLERRAALEADMLSTEEARAKGEFVAAAKKHAHREELKRRARIISNISARRRQKLKHQEQYQATLQEIENVKALKDQTAQMNRLARLCRKINMAIPMHAAVRIEREYSKAKMEMHTKADMMSEILEDEDEELTNKETDADVLVDTYLDELNITLASAAPAPSAEPITTAATSSSSVADHDLIARVERLG